MRADLEKHDFIEKLVNDKVRSYTVKNGCEEGDNVAGSLKTIEVIIQDGKELILIFKIIPENVPQWIIDGHIFRTEHSVYRTLLPLLKKFASRQGFQYDPPTPKYFTGFNNDKDDYICLEDVRSSGFIMPDKFKSLTLSEMNLILKELAKFHAVSYALIAKEGEQILETEDLKYLTTSHIDDPTYSSGFRTLVETYYEETTKMMKNRNPEIGKRMERLVPNVWELFQRTPMNTKFFKTIIHFDLWVNNLLIKYVDNEPSEVKLIDFQFVQKGNILEDLQYLIFTSTTPEFRKNHIVPILNGYFDHLTSTLIGLKYPKPHFTQVDLIDQFYECYLPAFIHMTMAIPYQLGYNGKDSTEDNLDQGSTTDFYVCSIHRQYRNCPLALLRLDSIANEMIERKLI